MKPQNITFIILAKLGFTDPIDYDVKPDGELVVLDRTCQKYKFSKTDYENLLDDAPLQPEKVVKRRGRRPKQVVGHS